MGKAASKTFDPKSFLSKISRGATVTSYAKGETIYAQGDKADHIFYVQKGSVKVVVTSSQGKEAVVGILEAGQFFGEGSLGGQTIRIGTTVALETCTITAVEKAVMVEVLHRETSFSEMFMAYLLKRNNRIEEDLVDQLFNSSEKRLARVLLLLSNFGTDNGSRSIATNITQETLAELIGTTRSRVSFFMNKFRRLGFIAYNGKIEVHPALLNAVLREIPETVQGREIAAR